MESDYTGRFAPSPTGPLHMGSLVAAVGSFVRARSRNGRWFVRMEDLDPPREQQGANDHILSTLQIHGLKWDGEVLYQSQCSADHQAAVDILLQQKKAYYCTCSRKQIAENAINGRYGLIYPGYCWDKNHSNINAAVRLRTDDRRICLNDLKKGKVCQQLKSELGDFIIKRADGYFAYQLAVVVDDEKQGITEVVRGEDLLDNTPRQIHLQRLLGYHTPDYLHLPLVTNKDGEKLSKQTHAPPLDNSTPTTNLREALGYLGISSTSSLKNLSPEEILQWYITNSNLIQ